MLRSPFCAVGLMPVITPAVRGRCGLVLGLGSLPCWFMDLRSSGRRDISDVTATRSQWYCRQQLRCYLVADRDNTWRSRCHADRNAPLTLPLPPYATTTTLPLPPALYRRDTIPTVYHLRTGSSYHRLAFASSTYHTPACLAG